MENTTDAAARAEALRCLTAAENVLMGNDLLSCKSFAVRARDSDPALTHAHDILAIVDTLLAADRRLDNCHPDWYAILRLTPPQGQDAGAVANQYHNLLHLLNPKRNRYPFAERAIRLVYDAWSVLSDPSAKSLYDEQIGLSSQQPGPFNGPMPTVDQQQFVFYGGGGAQPPLHGGGSSSFPEPVVGGSTREPGENPMCFTTTGNVDSTPAVNLEQLHDLVLEDEEAADLHDVDERKSRVEEKRPNSPVLGDGSSFWTACPYCYYMYEYPQLYVDCAMKCQKCKKAFEAIKVPPPPLVDRQEVHYFCWGVLPFGFSEEDLKKHNPNAADQKWIPFSPMINFPRKGNTGGMRKKKGVPNSKSKVDKKKVVFGKSNDELGVDKKKEKDVRKGKKVCVNNANVQYSEEASDQLSKEGVAPNAENQDGMFMKDLCRLDLNEEISNAAKEPAMGTTGSERGDDHDNIEGNGFFEGLEEYLSNLPY